MTIDEINIPQATCTEFQLTCQNTGLTYELEDEVLIGRELDCTIRLAAPQVKRYHAKISKSEDGLFLEDLNSKNNTYLNGCRIGTGAWITLGDEIDLDGVRFNIEPKREDKTSQVFAPNFQDSPKNDMGSKEAAVSPIDAAMPFSNQDVVEATRALEERAKARLQLFKATDETGVNPDWENFITKRNKAKENNIEPIASDDETESAEDHNDVPTEEALSSTTAELPVEDMESSQIEIDQSEATADVVQPEETQHTSAFSELPEDNTKEELADPNFFVEKPEQEEAYEATALDLGAANDSLNSEEQAGLLDMIDNIDEPPVSSRRAKSVLNLGSGPRLIVQTAPTRGKVYQLAKTDAKCSWTIGRSETADIQISEESIDRIHAHIEEYEGAFKVRTTRTTNGMLINDRFKGEASLNQGDVIQFGRMSFEYREDTTETESSHEQKSAKINWGTTVSILVILGSLLAALLAGK